MESPATDRAPSPPRAWDVPEYRRFLLARSVAIFGSALSQVAFPILVFRMTGSAALTALTAVVETLPYLVVGLLAGALADRWDRRRTIVAGEIGSGLALLSVPAAAAADALTVPHLLLTATAVSTFFVFTDAATFGLVPRLVGRERVASATATLAGVGTLIAVVGPVAGGVLVAVIDPAWVLGVDGVAYLVSAAVIAGIGVEAGAAPAGAGPPVRLRTSIAEGLRFIRHHPLVLRLTVLGIGCSLASGALTGLLVVLGVDRLGLADDDPLLGWLFAAGAAGSLLATLLLPRLQRHLGVGLITTAGYAIAWAALVVVSVSRDLALALPAVLVFHLAATTVIVNGIITRQVVTPDALQGRVNTTARLIAWGGSPLGAGLAGVLAEGVGTGGALRIVGSGLAMSVVLALVTGLVRTPRLDLLDAAE